MFGEFMVIGVSKGCAVGFDSGDETPTVTPPDYMVVWMWDVVVMSKDYNKL